jgi:hypothetical protein
VNVSQGVVLRFEQSERQYSGFAADTLWPLIELETADRGSDGAKIRRTKLIVPESFDRTVYRVGKCPRSQVPLRLAWAITIHKS